MDDLALLHMKILRDDSKIFSRLWICFGDAVRLLIIISQFAHQRVKEKPSLTAQKDFTPRTKSVYQTKYVWLLFFFYIINNPVCKESLLSWPSCSRISDLIVLPAPKEMNSELKQWSYYTHRKGIIWVLLLCQFTWVKDMQFLFRKRIEFLLVLWLTSSIRN